jgi:hypothetical protein
MRVILCPCDKPSLSLSSDIRERALSDGSHRVDVNNFYVMTEFQSDSKCHAPSSLRQLFFIMNLMEVIVLKTANCRYYYIA